jgi:hypothetical protein
MKLVRKIETQKRISNRVHWKFLSQSPTVYFTIRETKNGRAIALGKLDLFGTGNSRIVNKKDKKSETMIWFIYSKGRKRNWL